MRLRFRLRQRRRPAPSDLPWRPRTTPQPAIVSAAYVRSNNQCGIRSNNQCGMTVERARGGRMVTQRCATHMKTRALCHEGELLLREGNGSPRVGDVGFGSGIELSGE